MRYGKGSIPKSANCPQNGIHRRQALQRGEPSAVAPLGQSPRPHCSPHGAALGNALPRLYKQSPPTWTLYTVRAGGETSAVGGETSAVGGETSAVGGETSAVGGFPAPWGLANPKGFPAPWGLANPKGLCLCSPRILF
uniref:Uncharacterized protein n=1 Tax=Tolypothrix bouteillei VB521301 TaxID=1479485 RepID=A0A0C1QYV6_9CYAN